MRIKEQGVSGFGLIQKLENGDIAQVGLTESQYRILIIFLNGISSKDEPLIMLPKEYNLIPQKHYQLDQAISQLTGFIECLNNPSVISLVESMGLEKEEWEQIKLSPCVTHREQIKHELDEYFKK